LFHESMLHRLSRYRTYERVGHWLAGQPTSRASSRHSPHFPYLALAVSISAWRACSCFCFTNNANADQSTPLRSGIVVVGAVAVGATIGSSTPSATGRISILSDSFRSNVDTPIATMSEAIANGMAKSFVVIGFMHLQCSMDRNEASGLGYNSAPSIVPDIRACSSQFMF